MDDIGAEGGEDRLGRVQALVRAFGVLDMLSQHPDGLTLTEVSRLIVLPRSTVHRLLVTMGSLHFVGFDNASNRWHVGLRAFKIGSSFSHARDIARLGRPIMHSLMLDTHETVNVSVAGEAGLQYVGQVHSASNARNDARSGCTLPLHATAAGKAMIANWAPSDLAAFLRQPLSRQTDATIVHPDLLHRHLLAVRTAGYAIDDEEHATGMRCIAAPIFDSSGVVRASLSISAPCARLQNDRLPSLGAALARAATHLSRDLGHALAV